MAKEIPAPTVIINNIIKTFLTTLETIEKIRSSLEISLELLKVSARRHNV